jgi:hypothetical protein
VVQWELPHVVIVEQRRAAGVRTTIYIFDFFITLNFLIKRIIKINLKVKDDKYLRIEGV